jgi:hypothetical protein
MISRRDLIICSAMTLAAPAAAQVPRRLFVLPKGVTSVVQNGANAGKRVDLEGWLVCNGASVYRTAYPELFTSMGPNAGLGAGDGTFALPDLHVDYRDGQPVKGTAICPFSSFGTPAGVMMPFDLNSNS